MWKRWIAISIIGIFLGFIPVGSSAFAKKKKAKKKESTIELNSIDLKGELLSPEGAFLSAGVRKRHTLLISPRKDFVEELVESAEDL